jgi:hypothetical protein
MLKEAIKAVAAARKKKKGREIAEKSIAEKKSTTTSEESDDDDDDSLPSSISDEEDKNKNKNKEAKKRGRSSTDSGETFETTTTGTNNNGTSEDSDEDGEKKEKNRKRRMRRKGSPTDTDDEEEAYVRELSTQQQRLKKVKRTNMIDTNTAMMTALGGGAVPAAQVAPIAVPQLTLDQIQQLLAQQQLMQMQNLQQQFVLQQQELMRNPPKDFMSALQFLQQQQVQAMYNFNNSGANAASAAVMLNQATSGSLPPSLLNSLSSAMNGGNIGNNALAPLIQEELQLKLKQQQMKEYRKELKKKEKLLEKQKKYPYANESFKSIMSQQLEGSMDQQMEEDEEGDEERARATVSVQRQSDDSGRIAPKAGASGIGVPTQSAATTTTTITPSLKEQREILNAKNANHKEASQFVSGRACGVQGCELLCEKSRSLVGVVQQCCEMHKREDSFNLKERECVFRWCFYCHRPQKIEEFSSSSKSICREKFALRKQRRKLASQKQKLLAEASKTQIPMQQYVTVEHLQQQQQQQQQQQLIEMMQSKQAKSKSSKKKEKRPRTSEEKEAMRALCDILADEERRESEEKQRAEKESSQEDA